MSTSTSPIFNGTSSYSSDFQQVISRAVSIASLPIDQLTTEVTTLTSEQTALSSLSTSFSSLQSAVTALASAASSGNSSASSSDNTVATVTAGSGSLPGSYSLEVDDPGLQASAVSYSTVTDPTTQNISSSTSFTLTANGQQYTIVPPPDSNTLDSLVSAINTTTQGEVQATVVNIGTLSQPSYELSIQSAYGPDDIELDDGTGNILGDTSQGSPVLYRVNGQPPPGNDPMASDSQTLSLAPGLTATVAGTVGTTAITVSQNTSSLSNALNNFVTSYNAASQALAAQRGSSGGALDGQSIVNTLSQSLQALTNFTSSGSIQSPADVGLTFDQNFTFTFDPTVLSSAASSNLQGVLDFLGSPTGGGFLEAATNTLNSVMDSSSGAIANEQSGIAAQIATDHNKISTDQNQVDTLQTNLTNQMDAADALIAEMQQQYTYMTGLFASMTASQNSSS